jgi:hypothetical protein
MLVRSGGGVEKPFEWIIRKTNRVHYTKVNSALYKSQQQVSRKSIFLSFSRHKSLGRLQIQARGLCSNYCTVSIP